MNFYKTSKLFGLLCTCTALTVASHQTVFAGPSNGMENEMVATVEGSDVSIYAEENESSAVVAMAQSGVIYDVLELCEDNWIKVSSQGMEGYLKADAEVHLTESEDQEGESDSEESEEALRIENSDNALRQQVVNYALSFVGGRYKYGGNDPHTGVDCSGFTRYVMQHGAGIGLNRSSGSQASQGRSISAEEMQPGDLIFYSNGKRINHVAMYIGDGQIVHASTEKTGIKISQWNYRNPVKIISVLG